MVERLSFGIAAMAALVISTSAQAQTSTVCRVLEKSNSVVSATYKPGVDVHGKAVVPADVNGAPTMALPAIIKVPLDIDLVKRISILKGKNITLDAPMGMIDIHQNGKVTYNDQDWTASVMSICGFSHAVINDAETQSIEKHAEIEPAAQAQPEPAQPASDIPAKGTISKQEQPIKIITNRPDLIEGGAYRNHGE